jgi:hypothetical protein
MNPLAVSVSVSALVFGGAWLGLHLHRILPERHLSAETHEVIRLGTGTVSVLASLVLGLLIATANTSFNGIETAVRAYSAEMILLDETLRDYGDAAIAPRRLLRDYTVLLLRKVWPKEGGSAFIQEGKETGALLEHVRDSIRALKPVDDDQHWLKDEALQASTSLLSQRWLMIQRGEPSVRPIVTTVLVAWMVAIFISFGLRAPRNATVYAAFAVCALAIGSSIFIILAFDSPFAGAMRISNQPVRTALAHMLPTDQEPEPCSQPARPCGQSSGGMTAPPSYTMAEPVGLAPTSPIKPPRQQE